MRLTTFTFALLVTPCRAGVGDKLKEFATGSILPLQSEQSTTPPSPSQPPSPRPSPPPPLLPPSSPPPIDVCFEANGWGARGQLFRGSVSRTISGRACQLWRRQYPHEHSFEASLGEDTPLVSNYCRNPTDVATPLKAAPWCYTSDPKVEFELCDVCSANKKLLRPVSAPHVHKPVPQWAGPLCLAFSLAVMVAVLGFIGWKLSGRECGSACEEMAFGKRRGSAPRGQGRGPRPPPPAGEGVPRGNITTGEGTFSTLAGLARFQAQGSTAPAAGASRELKSTAGLALLQHDMVSGQPSENFNVV